jgi:hypothetical protein
LAAGLLRLGGAARLVANGADVAVRDGDLLLGQVLGDERDLDAIGGTAHAGERVLTRRTRWA